MPIKKVARNNTVQFWKRTFSIQIYFSVQVLNVEVYQFNSYEISKLEKSVQEINVFLL